MVLLDYAQQLHSKAYMETIAIQLEELLLTWRTEETKNNWFQLIRAPLQAEAARYCLQNVRLCFKGQMLRLISGIT